MVSYDQVRYKVVMDHDPNAIVKMQFVPYVC